MSRRARPAPLLLLLLLAAVPARAAVDGSPHDLISQGYDAAGGSAQEERCSVCHLSTSSAAQGFLPQVAPVLAETFTAASLMCFSCHDGTTIVSRDVDASRTAFHPASHGYDLAGYEGLHSEAVGLPHVSGRVMQCLTCHDPHENGRRPFLRANAQDLCLVCHSRYAEYGMGKENRTGSHVLAPDPLGPPKPGVPLTVDEAFRTVHPSPYPLQGGKAAGSWHWSLGGHLSEGRSGGIVCSTCHAVHGQEEAAPRENLLPIAPTKDLANLFCEGCHDGARGDGRREPPRPNPGGTAAARTYHPVDDDEGNAAGRLVEIREPPGWPLGAGTPRRLLCTTCHAAHAAQVETPLLRPTENAPGFCEACHEAVPEFHHAVGELEEGRCAEFVALPAGGAQRALYCASCHRAHNAGLGSGREADFVPILREHGSGLELCTACHPADNPTCSDRKEGTASHFLGDPTLPDTYANPDPPLKDTPWPVSGLSSLYGGDKRQSVTCLSCHSFRPGAIVSGDNGDAKHLLALSGNPVEWETDPEVYLCTGCHSTNPGTGPGDKGHTHPLMNAEMERLGREPQPPLSKTEGGRVNCDSCHRPHEALVVGGYYILEALTSTNTDGKAIHPEIDYTPLCHGCHDPGKY